MGHDPFKILVGWATMQLAHPIRCISPQMQIQPFKLTCWTPSLFQQFTRTCSTLLTLLLLRRILESKWLAHDDVWKFHTWVKLLLNDCTLLHPWKKFSGVHCKNCWKLKIRLKFLHLWHCILVPRRFGPPKFFGVVPLLLCCYFCTLCNIIFKMDV